MSIINFFNKKFIYNSIGSLFDKSNILLITVLIAPVISPKDFGLWSITYQFILISSVLVSGFNEILFQRNFFKKKFDGIIIFNPIYSISIIILSVIIYYFFIKSDLIIYESVILIFFISFNYLALFYRLKNNDKNYLFISFVRLLIFSTGIYIFYDSLSFIHIVLSFLFSLLPSFVLFIKNIDFKIIDVKFKEIFFLSIYAFSSALFFGFDKFVILGYGFSLDFLGYYSLVLSISLIPNSLVEIFKKTYAPFIYKELSERDKLFTSKYKKNIYPVLIILFLFQLILPFLFVKFYSYFNLISNEYLLFDDILIDVLLISFGLAVFNNFHFLNPIFFHFKKENLLIFSNFTILIIYLLFLFFFPDYLILIKTLSFIFLLIFVLFFLKFKITK